ncbi:MAG: hypothetical protein AB7V08_13705 [Elusimicrobiales bacterium]
MSATDLSQLNVIELGSRMRVDVAARNMMATLKAGPAIAEAMSVLFPELPQNEQRVLATIIAFRLQGAMMPASPELFAHLPLTAKMSEPELFAAVQSLVDGDALQTVMNGHGEKQEMCFFWPALEVLVQKAIEEQDAPRIITP